MTETSTWSSLLGHPKVHSGQPDDRWMVTYPRGLLGDREVSRLAEIVLMASLWLGMMAVVWPLIDALITVPFLDLKPTNTLSFEAAFRALFVMSVVALIPGVCYEIGCISRWGCTLCKKSTLRVIRWDEYQNPTGNDKYPDLFFSAIRCGVLHMLFPLVAVSMMFDKDGRGWHDKAAGTIVVKAPRPEQPTASMLPGSAGAVHDIPVADPDRWDVKASAAIVSFVSRVTGRSKRAPEPPEPRGDRG